MRIITINGMSRRSDRVVLINREGDSVAEVAHVYAGDANTDRWAFVVDGVAHDLGDGAYIGTLEVCVARWREFTRLGRLVNENGKGSIPADTTVSLPIPDQHGRYRFSDGCLIARPHTLTLNFLPLTMPVDPASVPFSDKWVATCSDRTPLRGEDPKTGKECTSYFDSAEEAAAALAFGGEGPARDPRRH